MASFLKAPFFPILFFYIAGLLSPPKPILYPAFLVLFATASIYLIKTTRTSYGICLAALSFFALGQIIQTLPAAPSDPSHIYHHLPEPRKTELIALVASPPEKFEKKIRVYVKSQKIRLKKEWITAKGLIRIDLYGQSPSLKYGDRILLSKVKLSRPENFRNPGGFDYVRYLRNRDIFVTGWTGKKSRIEILEGDQGNRFFSLVAQTRSRMESYADRNMAPRHKAIFKALIFGQRGELTQGDTDLFYETGIAHLTAVSGLHIGFVAFFSFFILEWVAIRLLILFYPAAALAGWSSRLAALATILPVIFYALLVGEKLSCVRAAIMSVLFLLSIAVRRGHFHYYTLAAAALVILIWKPGSLYEAGFQLSFSAVFFILFLFSNWIHFNETAYSPLTATRFEAFAVKYRRLTAYIFVSLFASLGVLPIIIYHFNRLALLSVPLNFLTVPLATIVVTFGLFLSFFSIFFQAFSDFFSFIPELSIAILIRVTEIFSNIPYCSIRLPTPSVGLVISFYILLTGITLFRKSIKKSLALVICAMVIIAFPFTGGSAYKKGVLSVTFLDVGQGDSTFVRFPDGKTMLIDGGRLFGSMDVGKWIVGPFLWDMGLRKVDYLVATHPDNDHIGGLAYLLNEFVVGTVFDNNESSENLLMKKIRALARTKNVLLRELKKGDKLTLGKVTISVINPDSNAFPLTDTRSNHKNENNSSIVLRLECGNFSVLLAGDIESEAEERMRESAMNIQSTILKIPHHGSRTSSSPSFIQAVKPHIAVVSAEKHNRFGHPDPDVINRYRKAGIEVYRTAECGAIEVFSDCETYRVKTTVKCD